MLMSDLYDPIPILFQLSLSFDVHEANKVRLIPWCALGSVIHIFSRARLPHKFRGSI